VRFETPEHIPMIFAVNGACWNHYPQDALKELMAEHPRLFPGFKDDGKPVTPHYGSASRADEPYTDDWGCVWETTLDGITGTVTGHPLSDWAAFDSYVPPDPESRSGMGARDWDAVAKGFARTRERGGLLSGGLPHGHTFLRLCDIRGYENVIFDMADGEPRLKELIRMVEEFNLAVIERFVKLGAEYVSYPEDLGMQVGPMISPAHFREYIKPVYSRLMAPAIEAGCVVHMHSDGDIRVLADDLVASGVGVLNLQDLVNGIDWIAERYAGKLCIDLDIDRQEVTHHGTPDEIDKLIRREVEALGSKRGGLMMIYGLYPGVPLENVKALMDAMERYATYYS
jgi:uroporphyrinogen decarboxylase